MKNIIGLVLITITNMLFAQNIVAPSLIDNNSSWLADTVFLNSDVDIFNGISLTIAPGTVVMSNGNYKINVQGTIRALGTEEDSIFFTVSDTTGFADSSLVTGGWDGIHFENTSNSNDSSIFEYCVMQYGKAFGETEQKRYGGFMYVTYFDKLRISHSYIRNNWSQLKGGAFFMEYCSAKVNLNRFTHNTTFFEGGAIRMYKQSEGIIDRNIFKYNVSYRLIYSGGHTYTGGAGAGVSIGNEGLEDIAPIVCNNQFYNNLGPSGILYDSTKKGRLINNTICNNKGVPIYIGHSLNQTQCINNTIAHNDSFNMYNNGIVADGLFLAVNNIVWNNWSSYYPSDTLSINYNEIREDSIRYNLLGDDYMQGTSNVIMENPLFVNPSPGIGLDYDGELYDWALQDGSPAINAGEPLSFEMYSLPEFDNNGNNRVYGGRIDIGAYENQNIIWDYVKNIEPSKAFSIFPNPASTSLNIMLTEDNNKSLIIVDISGKIVKQIEKLNLDNLFDISNLEEGLYFVKIGKETKKLIVE